MRLGDDVVGGTLRGEDDGGGLASRDGVRGSCAPLILGEPAEASNPCEDNEESLEEIIGRKVSAHVEPDERM